MSDLTLLSQDLIQPSKYGTQAAHANLAGSSFLPRIQLMGANAGLCKKGKVPMGTYAVLKGKDTVVHLLGEEVDLLVLSWRPKAIRFASPGLKIYYNPSHPEFRKIEVDSQTSDSGCLYGPEYLVYVPSVGEVAAFHFNNPTMRAAASGMVPNIGKAVTCKVELIEKGKHSWHGPIILNCSTPLPQPDDPAAFVELVRSQIDKFNNPKEEEELEKAPDEPDRAR